MTLDTQARAYLDSVSGAGSFPVSELTPTLARRRMNATYAQLFGPVDPVGATTDVVLPGPGGRLPVRAYRPESAVEDLPALVYLHGGGWVIGDLDSHDGVCRALCARSGCLVFAVDYRLAPEHPFPAGLEDAWAATAWVAEHGRDLGARPGAVAVAGDSAGGALAAVVARRARYHGLPLACQLLVFPVTDGDFGRPSYSENDAIGPSIASLQWFWDCYVGRDGDRTHPDASPLRDQDVAGVARAHVITAEYDTLRDESEAYADRLAAAGVEVTRTRYDGLIHGFFRMRAVIDRADECLDECAEVLAGAFASRS